VLRLLKSRFLVPLAVVVVVGAGGTLAFGLGAGAQGGAGSTASTTGSTASTTGSTATTTTTGPKVQTASDPSRPPSSGSAAALARTALARAACAVDAAAIGYPGPPNSGTPRHSDVLVCSIVNGRAQVVYYGNSAITYAIPSQKFLQPPSAAYINAGHQLFLTDCATCHGDQADGSTGIAPNLVGLGPATVDFWVTTGRMPAATPYAVEAERKPPRLTKHEADQIGAWVNSLDPAAPYIPHLNLSGANVAEGASLFALNCAACHTITGAGDALANNTFAPSLRAANARQVAEAIRTGPANMPRFTGNLSDAQVRDLVAYVTEHIQHPTNIGGFGLGGVGPVAEGFVALLFGVGILMIVAFWIGDRSKSR
jgi:ubiquinol-cytochrome c reductase cytochrome c subunit